ncbi:MAG: hypothetical protein F6K19_45610 [Cyanothece sp. SIO1E1]|nr:hypothetical protein [Cyanothece sp. SIO1E1]
MNAQIQETLDWLRSQDLPPLPIAPAQNPERYPARNKDGSIKRGADGAIAPAFTGKNPSYLDANGIPHLVKHTRYQTRMPTAAEIQMWFANAANGIGTLGGWHDVVWIDIDRKQFGSLAESNLLVKQWLDQHPVLKLLDDN